MTTKKKQTATQRIATLEEVVSKMYAQQKEIIKYLTAKPKEKE